MAEIEITDYNTLKSNANARLLETGQSSYNWTQTVNSGTVITKVQMDEVRNVFSLAYDNINIGCKTKYYTHCSSYKNSANTSLNSPTNSYSTHKMGHYNGVYGTNYTVCSSNRGSEKSYCGKEGLI